MPRSLRKRVHGSVWMTESDARAVLLLRACERAGLCLAADADWAGREARRQLGEAAAAPHWLALRARLGLARLAERDATLRGPLQSAQHGAMAAAAWLLLPLAIAIGVLGEGLGSAPQINLLALPLLGLLIWNLAVVAWSVAMAAVDLTRAWLPARAGGADRSAQSPGWAAQLLPALERGRAVLRRWRGGLGRDGAADNTGATHTATHTATNKAMASFAQDWWRLSRPLQAARGQLLLHAAAALLVLGALLSLYLRGLVADYRAGWDSTFLQPPQVHALLHAVLGPASQLIVQPLPDVAGTAALRLASGGGEGAAPWLHRWALTLLLAAVLPRALLAGLAGWRAQRLAARLALDADPELLRQLQAAAGDTQPAQSALVLPYSYQLDAARQAALAPSLARALGAGLRCSLLPGLALGAEDEAAAWLPATLARLRPEQPEQPEQRAAGGSDAPPQLLVLLFALTATPEHESHGAVARLLSQAIAREAPHAAPLRVAVDVSGFRQRLHGADAAQRLAARQAAWDAVLRAEGLVPVFIDLLSPAGAAP